MGKKEVLTKNQSDVYKMIAEDFMTPKQIAKRRGTSLQAVYKIIRKIQDRGWLSKSFTRGLKTGYVPTFSESKEMKRLHGQEFHIDLIRGGDFYEGQRLKSNLVFLDGNTVRLFPKSVEVYGHEFLHFWGVDAQDCYRKSIVYWKGFFQRLENRLRVLFLKDGMGNIREVRSSFADTDNEVAKSSIRRKEKVQARAVEDGKVWLLTDDSFSLKELETVHPVSAKRDMDLVDRYLNDWRSCDPPTNSELAGHVRTLVQDRAFHAADLRAHVAAVKKLGSGVDELVRVVKKFGERQSRLQDFGG